MRKQNNMTKFVWNEENTTALQSAVAGKEVITQEDQKAIGEQLGTSGRSVGSKLRKLGFTNVAKAAEKAQLMTAEEISELEEILAANPGAYTYAEIAAVLANGKFSTKQVQGKVLSLELTGSVKAAPKKEAVRSYTPAEEAVFLEMAEAGASVEDLAAALGRTIQQIRGKGLSLNREGKLAVIPKQAVKVGKEKSDSLAGVDFAAMTVAEIAAAPGKTERGIKSILTRRELACADHDGKAKHNKTAAAE